MFCPKKKDFFYHVTYYLVLRTSVVKGFSLPEAPFPKMNITTRYVQAVQNTRYMGSQLISFIQFLEAAGVPASSLHVIGFSLGAEAAGFAGKGLKSRGIMIGRITGEYVEYTLLYFKVDNSSDLPSSVLSWTVP